jgi:hypothetical protein
MINSRPIIVDDLSRVRDYIFRIGRCSPGRDLQTLEHAEELRPIQPGAAGGFGHVPVRRR